MGYLGPGGPLLPGRETCTGGAHRVVDDRVFGQKHIYGSPECQKLYMTSLPYDPEGLTGGFNAVAMCFLGLQAGRVLLYHRHHKPPPSKLDANGNVMPPGYVSEVLGH